jgi:hypothetical protein
VAVSDRAGNVSDGKNLKLVYCKEKKSSSSYKIWRISVAETTKIMLLEINIWARRNN